MSTKMTLIATKGTLDWAYPPFILASTAAALDYEVSIFFTFYGLTLLKKNVTAQVSPLGNPAMPMKMPMGPKWFRDISWNIPNIIQANIPGYESVATALMKKTIANNGVATIEQLRDLCIEAGVKMLACQMSMDVMGVAKEELLNGIEVGGVATYLEEADKSNLNLFI